MSRSSNVKGKGYYTILGGKCSEKNQNLHTKITIFCKVTRVKVKALLKTTSTHESSIYRTWPVVPNLLFSFTNNPFKQNTL